MQINAPTWNLKVPCPCCGQGRPMILACRHCGHLAAACEEVDTFFPDITLSAQHAPSEQRCIGCGAEGRDAFVAASSTQIQNGGLRVGEYQ